MNKLILTHGHIDHIGGAKSLVSKIQVENLLYSAPPNGEFEKELLEVFKKSGSNIIYVKKDDYWIVDHNQFIVVSSNHHDENMNERSIVLYANIGGLNWLFTGDLEEEGEKKLNEKFP
ncbi:MBL fold metallo-hydrolase [Anaerobacillus sp. HL2]|nr:MBL fold metallo-hydrolase [Anaerobacillus sp. HL2]